jgi:SAM-dependent methyltransferase
MGKIRGVRVYLIFATVIIAITVGSFAARGGRWDGRLDVRFVATPEEVVVEILKMARVTPADIVYDLGCGDGRIVIAAAKNFGARGVGVDIDPLRIEESTENARQAGVLDRVRFLQQDLFQTDIREATVVTLYLLEDLNLKLRPKLLRDLKPGTRILSHEFHMGDWKPDNGGKVRNVSLYYQPGIPSIKDTKFYYWVVPANVGGEWDWSMPATTGPQAYTLRLVQHFQEVRGELQTENRRTSVTEAQLVGDQLSFTVPDGNDARNRIMRFKGQVTGDTITGKVEVQRGTSVEDHSWRANRERKLNR